MVDFVVHQQDPEDYVDDAKAAWLIAACAGPLTKDGGVEALVRVLETASDAPASLASVRARQGQGGDRRGRPPGAPTTWRCCAGWCSPAPARAISASPARRPTRSSTSTRPAAANADPAWPTFFAQAVDDALTAVSPFHVESRDGGAEGRGLAGEPAGPRRLLQADGRQARRRAARWRTSCIPYEGERREWQDADAQIEADEAAAAPITDEEADWLVGRLGAGPLSAAGRRAAGAPEGAGRRMPAAG